jgi:hypothetical protein
MNTLSAQLETSLLINELSYSNLPNSAGGIRPACNLSTFTVNHSNEGGTLKRFPQLFSLQLPTIGPSLEKPMAAGCSILTERGSHEPLNAHA